MASPKCKIISASFSQPIQSTWWVKPQFLNGEGPQGSGREAKEVIGIAQYLSIVEFIPILLSQYLHSLGMDPQE